MGTIEKLENSIKYRMKQLITKFKITGEKLMTLLSEFQTCLETCSTYRTQCVNYWFEKAAEAFEGESPAVKRKCERLTSDAATAQKLLTAVRNYSDMKRKTKA